MSSPGIVNLSISRSDAKIYIARVIGGAKNPDKLAMAEEAIKRSFSEWQNEKDWEFLLKDNSFGFTVDTCVTTISLPTVSAPSVGAFDAINIGITVTGTGIPASTTISSYTRSTDGTVATITLSNNASANGTVTLTFGGNIPIIAGTTDYNLPNDFYRHYGVRLTSRLKWPLTFIRPRDWNTITLDQTTAGTPVYYTIFNDRGPLNQNKGTYRLRILPVASAADIVHLEYYRKFAADADPLDMDGTMLYKFLDYCRGHIVATQRAFDDPSMLMDNIKGGLQKAKEKDESFGEDDEVIMRSQMEMGILPPLWTNGEFNQYGY